MEIQTIVPKVCPFPFIHLSKTHLLSNYFVPDTMRDAVAAFEELTDTEEIQISK